MEGFALSKIAVIGGGVAGLTVANLLKNRYDVTVFEKESRPGGLIRCKRINGSLFHICGGHVFNTKNADVKDWFWSKFDGEKDFIKADRKSAICLDDGRFVDYPIENHVYQLDEKYQNGFREDVRKMLEDRNDNYTSFGDFLLKRFGRTLYDLYFGPYNNKVWRRDLNEVPLSWLAGKLPMPTPEEMIEANEKHIEEKTFVHSTFYYEKFGGSQFIADTLAKDVKLVCGHQVLKLSRKNCGWTVQCSDGDYFADKVVFCGNIKDLPELMPAKTIEDYTVKIDRLKYHGTTAVFCETDPIPYSWFYQPSSRHDSHRFICTGNFAPSNNAPGKKTATVEFTDEVTIDEIKRQLALMPYHPKYLTHHFSPYTYPIQHHETRSMIAALKERLRSFDVYLCGRFAEWEYFNMDAAMASAMELTCDETFR